MHNKKNNAKEIVVQYTSDFSSMPCFIRPVLVFGSVEFSVTLSVALRQFCFTQTLTCFLFLFFLAACESAPVLELSEARQAISAAKSATILELNPALEKAERLITQAELALQLGDYRYARKTAQAAKRQAILLQKSLAAR